jgi:hypothetical protein
MEPETISKTGQDLRSRKSRRKFLMKNKQMKIKSILLAGALIAAFVVLGSCSKEDEKDDADRYIKFKYRAPLKPSNFFPSVF